ncbi:MAG TPA: hypothetical protein VI136_03670 [Verrucomicrobiae bacterium]
MNKLNHKKLAEFPMENLSAELEDMNASRVRWADIILEEFQSLTGSDLEDAVSDLLADLMHWCDQSGQNFEKELRRAQTHYTAETAPMPDGL